jgi:hypothetical protein
MMTETEMQSKFINENMDVLQKYLLWRETILPSQILDPGVEMPAVDTDVVDLSFVDEAKEKQNGTSGMSITEKVIENYGKMD